LLINTRGGTNKRGGKILEKERSKRHIQGGIFGVKKRNEPGKFEGVRRVKEQKKKVETSRETEERRGRTTGYGPHSCHHRLHRSSQSPPTAPSSSKNRRRDREVRGRKIQRNRGLRLCTGEKKTNCSKLRLPASLQRQQPLRHLQRRQQQLPPQKQKSD
jgi:hypothetical protein